MRAQASTLGGVLMWLAIALLNERVSAQQEPQKPPPAVPVEPIGAIVEAFQSHSLVALGDAHGNVQAQAFLRSLVRDPRFAAVVNDIVIEFGNARFQSVADRFVQGDNVPPDSVRAIWQQTTIANEIPVDTEFFAVVREVNASLPKDRQLRVLLGDPPIDWRTVRTREDHFKWLSLRDSYPAALIQLEVLAKQRRALVVYGQLHFQRKNVMSNLDMHDWRMQSIVSLIESATPTRLFTVWNVDDALAPVQPDIASWKKPSLVIVRGTTLGAADITVITPTPVRFSFRGESRAQIPKEEWRPLRVEDQLDAVLYLGPRSTLTQAALPKSICADSAYIAERLRRIALTGIPLAEAERVKQHCAAELPNQ